ncbi:hypothetical protein M5362_21730 [Streptomyces sp. Je 1-79]|uniref:hypothetical protein n=1 Tax=Streptomyces sp. Je 1-79 TaxID=2943847 RepID=UPI0021A4BD6D|nr:hypothetical protein [Streptomyces sp. Je 1-79]MCT4355764.1 hypothetical protein [Streptomyces sp. Je 1-79]
MATPEGAEARISRISMSDLLASCAAANVVSTPPREREPEDGRPEAAAPDVERDAA